MKVVNKIKTHTGDNYTFVYTPLKKDGIVTIVGSIEGGSLYNPINHSVCASLLVAMLDKGTKKYTKDQLQQKIDSIGATISFSLDPHRIRFHAQCLPEHVSIVLPLIKEQLAHPRLLNKELMVVKQLIITNIKRAEDDTRTLGQNLLSRTMFPKSHPQYQLSFQNQIKDIKSLTVKDLRQHHSKIIGGNDLKIVIAGGSDEKVLSTIISKTFGGWKEKILCPTTKIPRVKNKKVKVFETLKNKATTDIYIAAHTDLTSQNSEALPFLLALEIFGGGGLTSRLMSTVREKEGLTYGVYASLPGVYRDMYGYWRIWSTFAPKVLNKGLSTIKTQLNLLVKNGVTREEFKMVKKKYLGRYLIECSTTTGLASRILTDLEMGRTADYINERLGNLEKVTRTEVNKSIKKYMKTTQVTTVGAGSVTSTGRLL